MISYHISIYADNSNIYISSPDCSQYGYPLGTSDLTLYLYSIILLFLPCFLCQQMAYNPPSCSVQKPRSYPYSFPCSPHSVTKSYFKCEPYFSSQSLSQSRWITATSSLHVSLPPINSPTAERVIILKGKYDHVTP